MKEKGVGFGHWGGCSEKQASLLFARLSLLPQADKTATGSFVHLEPGRGDDFCEEGLCVKRDVRWPKEGYEERFWRVFCGFLE